VAIELHEAPASAPVPGGAGPTDEPTRPGAFGLPDTLVLLGSVAASFAVMWLFFFRLAPLSGVAGFCICWYLVFLAVYWFAVRELDGPVLAGDRVMGVVATTAALLLVVPLTLILGYVVIKGIGALRITFFTQTSEFVGPATPATEGGAAQAVVGTLEQVGLAVLMAVPLGFLCAIFLNEIGGPLRRPVRVLVDAMSGVPTIVAGLFIYAVWVLHFGFSGFAAALAISISMLPVITRTSEEVLRLVPTGLREASLALGTGEWRTVWGVVLPTARSGLITAVILGIARAIGETAPLIMTAFGSSLMNANPFSGAQSALPLYIYKQITLSSAANVQARAWTASLVLMLLVLTLFSIARFIGSRAARAGRLRRAPEKYR
jgi:phosphate transport system permease protein